MRWLFSYLCKVADILYKRAWLNNSEPNMMLHFYTQLIKYCSDNFASLKNNKFFFKNKSLSTKQFFKNKFTKDSLNYGIKTFITFFSYLILPFMLVICYIYYSCVTRCLPFLKITFFWFILVMLFYWLISGFVFFFKKYKFSKFTSAIQRFWRRTFIIFWLLETTLFLIFFYFVVNANQEPIYMYDSVQFYKTHLYSWRYFLLKLIPLTTLIFFSYTLLLNLRHNIFSKNNMLMILITCNLSYLIWLEFYQFFHLLSYYGNLMWTYEVEDHLWNLEVEFKRTRIFNHYVTICLIAKFWHFIFIFIFWIFFILRCLESGRVNYPLLSANFQNFVILYIMSWFFMYPWFKYVFRCYLDNNYYWLYTNNRRIFIFVFFNDFKLYLSSILSYWGEMAFLYRPSFYRADFFYWVEASTCTNYDEYQKFHIRNFFLRNIINK